MQAPRRGKFLPQRENTKKTVASLRVQGHCRSSSVREFQHLHGHDRFAGFDSYGKYPSYDRDIGKIQEHSTTTSRIRRRLPRRVKMIAHRREQQSRASFFSPAARAHAALPVAVLLWLALAWPLGARLWPGFSRKPVRKDAYAGLAPATLPTHIYRTGRGSGSTPTI